MPVLMYMKWYMNAQMARMVRVGRMKAVTEHQTVHTRWRNRALWWG